MGGNVAGLQENGLGKGTIGIILLGFNMDLLN